jgi:hypothetical protein
VLDGLLRIAHALEKAGSLPPPGQRSRTTPEEYRLAGPRRRDDSCDRTLWQTVVPNDVGTSDARLRADIRPAC